MATFGMSTVDDHPHITQFITNDRQDGSILVSLVNEHIVDKLVDLYNGLVPNPKSHLKLIVYNTMLQKCYHWGCFIKNA